METDYKLPENYYEGENGHGKHAQERAHVIPTQKKEQPKEELPSEELKESNEFENAVDSKSLHRAKYSLEDMASSGMPHHEILSVAKSIPIPKHLETEDSHLHNILASAPSITPEIHEQFRQALKKHIRVNSIPLMSKYSWVLHHPSSHVEPPPIDNKEDLFIPKEHVKKYLSENFMFNGGRIVTDMDTKSKHYIHTDGSLTPFHGYAHDTSALPFDSPTHGQEVKYHHDNLSEHFDRQISDQEFNRRQSLTDYTADSVGFNRGAAFSNKKKARADDAAYYDDSIFKKVHTLDSMVKDLDPYPQKFKVYSGLSRSTDPSISEPTSEGRKTVRFSTFLSTSLHSRTATGFTRSKPDNEIGGYPVNDVLELHIPNYHSGGVYVDNNSSNSGEHEYLLTHGHVIEHDAEPRYFAAHNKLYRFWGNGQIKGINQHSDWKHADAPEDKMTPEVTKQMENSHIPVVRDRSAFSQHASPTSLANVISSTNDIPTIQKATSHPNLDAKSLTRVLKVNDNPLVHRAATENPHFNDDHALESIHSYPAGADRVISHPNVSTGFAMFAVNHQDPRVRSAAIQSGKLDHNEISKKLDDKNPDVVRMAKLKLGLVEHEIESLVSMVTEVINKTSLNTA